MWVRSQDKTILANINDFFINNEENSAEIYGNGFHKKYCRLGIYDTPERTYEVLDMMQRMLINDIQHDVFIMPQR